MKVCVEQPGYTGSVNKPSSYGAYHLTLWAYELFIVIAHIFFVEPWQIMKIFLPHLKNIISFLLWKLDAVGPVDNGPSVD